MIRGALLDFGGTIDTDGVHWMQMFSMAYQACGLPVQGLRDAYIHAERTLGRNPMIAPDCTFRELIGAKIRIQLEYMCCGADEKPLTDFCYSYVAENIRRVSSPVLHRIAARMPLVLVSNFYGNMHTVLGEFGISGCFRDVIESSVVGVRKPDPEIFRLGASALGLDPGDTVAVGDSADKDIVPASAAGCHTVWLKDRGWSETAACSPDSVISSFGELPDILL